jgi:hypothetical protein
MVLVEKKVVMGYPYGGETRKEKSHDYRRHYPTHFLLGGDFFAENSATLTGEAVSERISYNWHPVFFERRLLSSLLPLAQSRLWRLVRRRDFTRENPARTLAKDTPGMVQLAFRRSNVFLL